PSSRELYSEALVGRGDITEEEAQEALEHFRAELERIFTGSRTGSHTDSESVAGLEVPQAQQQDAGVMVGWQTAIDPETLAHIGAAHGNIPEGFSVHPKLQQLLERRQKMALEGDIDWGFGEIAAFGSLLLDGLPVRLAGQDSRRGTFVQRHATFHDYEDGSEWTPLMHLSRDQAKFWVYDSALSEFAALGFEYGYSVERPDALVIWEAQFGDFVNGAQTVTDEFISSAEQKWGQRSSLVMLLPHGYEGQGPDHSSGRIERFLQLCAEDNMVVAQPSTPANHFHLLRRQAYQRPRRPLILFSPKQLLRLRAASSQIEDFTTGTFKSVIGDSSVDPNKVTRLILCSGRVYYDLAAQRTKQERDDIALVRVEELFPLPAEDIAAQIETYPNAELVWVQDEPENQGPWGYMALNLPKHIPAIAQRGIRVVSRASSAAPSAGTMALHQVEQKELLQKAFAK
ncbi:MAG TPA: multifunctional oxoglutarate decarboxylase/oxoglutarate dehydrogenase thiamine pyrophosphate-binding subunit/dihydrolipoyllysine-residue succinyltransferase subunit, partial [Beutenbergiaceae bacterium]|nr:multifunctional oxoglutarate decarboxylase/oxoglutarate dehydrogenase thiamine pyrophosphate-binding subunit/dihydrolipoyllysine-residue succinyltransferase subunit [Beutenbergiaceae bacterium]